jgi:hypothetical protein
MRIKRALKDWQGMDLMVILIGLSMSTRMGEGLFSLIRVPFGLHM